MNDEIREIAKRIKEAINPERIYLFGSYARGEQTEQSDYDFYVVVDDDAENPIVLSQKAYHAIRYGREFPCDVLVNYKAVFERRSMLPTIEKTVKNEGVLLYDR